MEVRPFLKRRSVLFGFVCLAVLLFSSVCVEAAQFETPNFIVTAETADFARQVAETAEVCRQSLAKLWLGVELPQWSAPCPIRVQAAPNLGAGGETSFTFKGNEVFGWKMSVQGTEERVLDSVIPHEVSHMILATYFRRPVPRWIDEGAATSTESNVERSNYRRMLIDFLIQEKGIPFNKMVRCKEYPADMMPFYSQGFSVCEYLIAVGGHRRLVEFARLGMESGDWAGAIQKFYGYQDLNEFQIRWTDWVSNWYHGGMPDKLPQVARVAEYRYDINGRPIAEETVLAASTVGRTGASSEALAIAAPPKRLAMTSGEMVGEPLVYQGSYGRLNDGATDSSLAAAERKSRRDERIAPPLVGAETIILGQQRR